MSDPVAALPPLQVADLDSLALGDLFGDIEALAEDVEIVVKRGPGRVDDREVLSLVAARRLLSEGRIHGVQLRYRYREAEWCDTLMRTPSGVRLVRIQSDHPGRDPVEASAT